MKPKLSDRELFASRMKHMGNSAIREMLKVAGRPGFISLGGGLPAPESFPVTIIRDLRREVEDRYGPNLFQYGKTDGFDPLIAALPGFLKRPNRCVEARPETTVITAGSQEALNILGLIFIEPGTKIAVETPTYLGALQAFSAYEPNYITVPTDRDGIVPDGLEDTFKRHPDIRFLYIIPTFQNPSGSTLTLQRRKAVARLLRKYGKIAVEDDPYSELRYDGKHLPSVQSFAPERVIYLFTFSKTLAPDFRIGGMVAPPEIRDKAVTAKQGVSLYTSNQLQALVAAYLTGRHIDRHIPRIIDLYRPRRDTMYESVKQYFPDEFEVNRPDGGMFLWARLGNRVKPTARFELRRVFEKAVARQVGFVSGDSFYADPGHAPASMRLNFTNQNEKSIRQGVKVIGEILKEELK